MLGHLYSTWPRVLGLGLLSRALEVWPPLEIYYFCLTYDLVPVGLAVVCLVGLDAVSLGVDL